MSLAVHLLRDVHDPLLRHLRGQLQDGIALTVGRRLPEPPVYEILVAGRPERKHVTASADLSAVIIPFAGVPPETRELMLDFPQIAVHNLHHNADPVTEMAAALMLAAAKFILPSDRALRQNDWRPRYLEPNPSLLLKGKTALILGYGAIGRRVARICRGLGINVIATRRTVSPSSPESLYWPEALPRLLPRANVLIISLPLTFETRGLIGEEELAQLPPRAVLVNVGRGPIVNEKALYRAL